MYEPSIIAMALIFGFLRFTIPSLIITVYAALIYKILLRVKNELGFFVPTVTALILASLKTILLNQNYGTFIVVMRYAFIFVFATIIALGIISLTHFRKQNHRKAENTHDCDFCSCVGCDISKRFFHGYGYSFTYLWLTWAGEL
ncbi:hypothetical protein DRP05_09315 [Archaeoglobales archaeon]|nr:MAG: hypothetical protein DRP05_09315 [Archaeoglobales archaeon]